MVFQSREPDELTNVPWGSHFCLFYETKEDLLEAAVPFFRQGLETNEYCLWVSVAPLEREEALQALSQAIPEATRSLEQGQLEILPRTDLYRTNENFEATPVLQAWIDKLDQALDKGYTGMRAVGNTFWMEKQQWKDFLAYEAQLDTALRRRRIKLLCAYSLEHSSAEMMLDVVQYHQFALIVQGGKWERLERAEYRSLQQEVQELRSELQQHLLRHQEEPSIPHTGSFAADGLSSREVEVLRLLAQGQANRDIAEALSLSVRTVERYRSSLMKKLELHSSAELIVYAVRHGFLGGED